MMPRDMIVFGEDWGGLPSSTQHLISNLAVDRKILWINSIGLRQPKLSVVDAFRVLKKLTRYLKSKLFGLEPAYDNYSLFFQVLNPITIPAPKSRIARGVSAKLLSLQVLPKIEDMKLDDPVFWTSLPTASDLTQYLGNIPVVYYCGDDFSSLEGVDHKAVSEHEKDLVACSDLIVTASDSLLSKFPKGKTKLMTHGVKLKLFSNPAEPASDLPSKSRPCAGFYGSLCDWLDQDLLEKVIGDHQNWNFVFIGEERVDFSRLKKFTNTKFLGSRPHSQLASYSQHWDVSLLPFKLNDQIKSCNPLKLKEYLAAGKPVISTSFPAVQVFSEFVEIAKNSEEFSVMLNKYPELDISMKKRRSNSVASEDWKSKARVLSQWIDAL